MDNLEVIKILSKIRTNNEDINEAISIAIYNTYKRIPLKPYVGRKSCFLGKSTMIICPTCGGRLSLREKRCECSQELDWSDFYKEVLL